MEPYIYVEYPKCLYDANGNTMTVDNREEEDAAVAVGWMDAATHFKYSGVEAAALVENTTGDGQQS